MRKKKNVKRVVSPQKIFCFMSFIFILTCCFWYGGRFVYFYLENKKEIKNDDKTFASNLKFGNHEHDTFRKDDNTYYFYQNANDNYLVYSNLVWRIVKINEDESITLISNDIVTNLAYGGEEVAYQDSPIIHWMNINSETKYEGMLEKNLNEPANYLVKNSVCIDDVTDVEKITCDKINSDYSFGLLSVKDYVKTGGKKSFINNGQASYLANANDSHKIWYIDNEGNLNQSLGDDILGIKVTTTLSSSVKVKSGNGTESEPYIIEDKSSYFGSYVKLGEDIWRVYDVVDNNIKLVLTDYVKDSNGEKVQNIYSKNTYQHNDTINGSFAYYLNHTYLNSLSYKDSIINANYYNGYYGDDNEYGLKELYEDIIDTKVALPGIGDIIFKSDLENYFMSTGLYKKATSVYVYKANDITTKKVSSEAYVVPCITISKDILKNGNGSKNEPYTME